MDAPGAATANDVICSHRGIFHESLTTYEAKHGSKKDEAGVVLLRNGVAPDWTTGGSASPAMAEREAMSQIRKIEAKNNRTPDLSRIAFTPFGGRAIPLEAEELTSAQPEGYRRAISLRLQVLEEFESAQRLARCRWGVSITRHEYYDGMHVLHDMAEVRNDYNKQDRFRRWYLKTMQDPTRRWIAKASKRKYDAARRASSLKNDATAWQGKQRDSHVSWLAKLRLDPARYSRYLEKSRIRARKQRMR